MFQSQLEVVYLCLHRIESSAWQDAVRQEMAKLFCALAIKGLLPGVKRVS